MQFPQVWLYRTIWLALAGCSSASAVHAPAVAAKPHAAASAASAAHAPAAAAKHAPSAVHAPTVATKHHVSSEDSFQNLGNIMATSQTSLSQAEAFYDKAVQKQKGELSKLLTSQATAFASSIRNYSASLADASAQLAQAANATHAKLDAIAPKGGVVFAEVEEQASVGAKVDAAAAEARRMARRKEGDQEWAVQQAVNQLEDAGTQVSRKLGDVSASVDDAKAIVEAVTSEAPPQRAVDKAASGIKRASLAELTQAIAAAKKLSVSQTATANKRLADSIKKVGADLAAGTEKVKEALQEAEKEEIKRVKDKRVDKVVAKHHLRRHRHRHFHF